jgi:hypothetical protein
MSTTVTTTRTARTTGKSRPADACRLILFLRGVAYRVRPLASEAGRAFRLRKADGTCHDVTETPHGPTCDCGDQVWRHEGRDDIGCKHIRGLRTLGLIEMTVFRPGEPSIS